MSQKHPPVGTKHRSWYLEDCISALGLREKGTSRSDVAGAIARAKGARQPLTKEQQWDLIHHYWEEDVPLVIRHNRREKKQTHRASVKKATGFWPSCVDPNSDKFLSSFEWRRLRMEVLTERGARCECCGASPKDGIVIHVDHIKPRRRFPELALTKANLQVLCEVCNHGKGSWDQTDWRPLAPVSEREMDTPVSRSGDGDGQTPVATGAPPDSSVMRPRLIRKTI